MNILSTMLGIRAKAIETAYNGYRFRSRLEARWAVFFDEVGIKYRYEPEGFKLDGIWYLPDFYLPQCDLWVEIKPFWPSNQECEKAIRLSLATHQNVTIFAGDVWWDSYEGILYHPLINVRLDDAKALLHRFSHLHWRSDNHVIYMPEEDNHFIRLHDLQRGFVCRRMEMWELLLKDLMQDENKVYTDDDIGDYMTPLLTCGYMAARGARFEHGERGRRHNA